MGTRYGPVKLRVPKGFPILLQRFAREVLREQPQDIARFGAEYFRKLADDRDRTGEDPLKADPFDEPGFKVTPLRPLNSETRQREIEQDNAATKIQAGYRGYRVRKKSVQDRQERQKEDKAAIKIQAGYRGYRTRKSLGNKDKPDIEKIPEEENVEQEKEKEEIPKYGDDHEKAAVRIQANYRGYQTRQSLKKNKKKVEFEEEPPIDTSDPNMEAAALKIQASFRGHKTRKQLKENESQSENAKTDAEADEGEKQEESEDEKESEQIGDKQDYDTEQVTEDKTEEPPIDTSDPDMEAAALKIQASFRGHQTRKQLKEEKSAGDYGEVDEAKVEDSEVMTGGGEGDKVDDKGDSPKEELQQEDQAAESPVQKDEEEPKSTEDEAAEKQTEVTLHGSDNENAAATKIQARYRGYRTRKGMRVKPSETETPLTEQADDVTQEDKED